MSWVSEVELVLSLCVWWVGYMSSFGEVCFHFGPVWVDLVLFCVGPRHVCVKSGCKSSPVEDGIFITTTPPPGRRDRRSGMLTCHGENFVPTGVDDGDQYGSASYAS